jgi:hypothetical protein
VTTVERSLAGRDFSRLLEHKRMAAASNHPDDEAKAETELRAWSQSSNLGDMWERHCSIRLEPILAKKLIEIWTVMLQNTREDEFGRIVVDGQTDHFWLNHEGNNLAGSAFAPPEDSNPGQLDAILQALPAYCQSGTNANLNEINTLMQHKADRNRIETLADSLLASLRGAKIP